MSVYVTYVKITLSLGILNYRWIKNMYVTFEAKPDHKTGSKSKKILKTLCKGQGYWTSIYILQVCCSEIFC